jgi:hypothetical protein
LAPRCSSVCRTWSGAGRLRGFDTGEASASVAEKGMSEL